MKCSTVSEPAARELSVRRGACPHVEARVAAHATCNLGSPGVTRVLDLMLGPLRLAVLTQVNLDSPAVSHLAISKYKDRNVY